MRSLGTVAAALSLLLATQAMATEAAIVEDFAEGETIIVVSNVGGVVTHRVVKVSTRSGGVPERPTDPGDPTPKNDLAEWTARAVQRVPDHKFKQETAIGLSAGYQGLAKAWRDGKVSDLAALSRERKAIHDRLVGALGVADQWKGFDAAVIAELNRRRPTGDQVPAAMESIAAGLVEGKAINPEIIAAGIKLVFAMLAKDQVAVTQAIAELIRILVGSIGNGSAFVGG